MRSLENTSLKQLAHILSRIVLAIGSLIIKIYSMSWIWEKKNWPQFYWDEVKILKICNQIHFQLGKLTAKCGIIDSKLSEQAELDCLLQNILKSSEIEGESLNVESVQSSLAKRLMIKIPLKNTSARTEGVFPLFCYLGS